MPAGAFDGLWIIGLFWWVVWFLGHPPRTGQDDSEEARARFEATRHRWSHGE
jgi:hypothetical protein